MLLPVANDTETGEGGGYAQASEAGVTARRMHARIHVGARALFTSVCLAACAVSTVCLRQSWTVMLQARSTRLLTVDSWCVCVVCECLGLGLCACVRACVRAYFGGRGWQALSRALKQRRREERERKRRASAKRTGGGFMLPTIGSTT